MKAIELLQKNPESSKLICSYYLEIMLESLNDDNLPEDFKAHVREQGIDDDKIAAIIDGNPRNLFDFFDNYGLIIEIGFMPELPMTGQFTYRINEELGGTTSSRRKDVDRYAIELAIEMLEEQLTNSVSANENS
jgi:hypothetical protein